MRFSVLLVLASGFTPVAACGGGDATTGGGGGGGSEPHGASTTSSTGSPAASSSGGGGGAAGGESGGGGGADAQGGGAATSAGGGGAGAGGEAGGGQGGSGGAPPPECTTDADTCPAGKYCSAVGCGGGACVDEPMEQPFPSEADLVCGCDGVTYWTADTAAVKGRSVAHAGACDAATATGCDPDHACADGLYCNKQVTDADACLPSATGVCWGLPRSCPNELPGMGDGQACSDAGCHGLCSLVASQNPWWDDGTCL